MKPDIITLGKPIAGGLPLGATLVKAKINDAVHPGDHGSTFGGNPVCCAVANAVTDTLFHPHFLEEVKEKGNYLTKKLTEALALPDIHTYSSPRGEKFYLEAVAKRMKSRFGVELNPKTEIFSLIGSKEGLANFIRALINPKTGEKKRDIILIPDPGYAHHIEHLLKDIYAKGIITFEEYDSLYKDSILSIQVVNKNISFLQSVSEIYNTKHAYETLINSDSLHYNKALLQRCNLNNYLTPNLIYDIEKSNAAKNDLLSTITWANGFVMNGQKIIDRGEIIDTHTYSILKSLQKEWEKRDETVTEKRLTLLGQIIFVSILISCFMVYLALFRHDYYKKKGNIGLLFSFILFFPIITAIMV